MPVPVEREVKLAAPESFALPAMRGIGGLHDGPVEHLDLDAVYFDTADLALARAGVTLRHRTGESGPPWTLKLPSGHNGATIIRHELRFDGAAHAIPAEVRDVLRGYLRARDLRPIARLHTDRTSVPLFDDRGALAATVVDDRVTAFDGDRRTTTFHEVEFELADGLRGARRLQKEAVARLVAAGCRAEPAQPKVVRVVGDAARAPAELAPPRLAQKPALGELIRFVFTVSAERMIRADPGVRLGEDPEEVHQFRVAARTLRSDLKTFGPALEPEWASRLRAELGWLGGEVGRVRDLDVLGERLQGRLARLAPDDAATGKVLLERAARQRAAARAAMLDALRSERYLALLGVVVAAAHAPAFRTGDSAPGEQQRARPVVRRAARRQLRRLDAAVDHLGAAPSDADLHRIRIQAKRTRYAMDAARPVVGRPAATHAAAIAKLQDVLGDLHDAVVAEQWLREAAGEQPECAVVAGELVAAERAEQTRLRGKWRGTWKAAAKRKLASWLH
ncbi:MAG TPA: CYTH and CHAD domain-containing protein [Jatrophihabitans sp.]|nr:CYTH and CHAD domain-containing protein [Jatrophihabitans sp.]